MNKENIIKKLNRIGYIVSDNGELLDLKGKFISNIVILFIVTSALVAWGLWVGYCIGNKYKRQIDICGGIILLSIGIKVICNYFNII